MDCFEWISNGGHKSRTITRFTCNSTYINILYCLLDNHFLFHGPGEHLWRAAVWAAVRQQLQLRGDPLQNQERPSGTFPCYNHNVKFHHHISVHSVTTNWVELSDAECHCNKRYLSIFTPTEVGSYSWSPLGAACPPGPAMQDSCSTTPVTQSSGAGRRGASSLTLSCQSPASCVWATPTTSPWLPVSGLPHLSINKT